MSSTPDPYFVLRRLAETIAWCRLHVSESDPRQSLRTPALRPANLALEADQWGIFDYEWLTSDDEPARMDAVSALAETRADVLRREAVHGDVVPRLPVDLTGGRLIIAMPHESDVCGLSESETEGFIDAMDVPA
jgi:hypothetical protein